MFALPDQSVSRIRDRFARRMNWRNRSGALPAQGRHSHSVFLRIRDEIMSTILHLRESQGKLLPRDKKQDLLTAIAGHLNCEVRVLLAILEVESGGDAFDAQGRLIILPERHIFYRYLPKKLRSRALRRRLATASWSRSNYKDLGQKGSSKRWDLLQRMAQLDEEAALKSASYGAAQIMGFNHKMCGYDNVSDFVRAMADSDAAQINAFVAFLESAGLTGALRERNFEAIARTYNGPGQVRRYAALMQRAYRRLGGTGDPPFPPGAKALLRLGSEGKAVAGLQKRLSELGYVVRPDGDFGPATRRAIVGFQVDHGLVTDGIAGPKTRAALKDAVPINEMPGTTRQDVDLDDLRKQGSDTVRTADWMSRLGQALFGTGALATGLDEASGGLLDGLGNVTRSLNFLDMQARPLLNLISDHHWLMVVTLGVIFVWLAHKIKQIRLKDTRTWRHLG